MTTERFNNPPIDGFGGGSGLRPVQLVREEDAHPMAKATEVPVYEPEACAGCPYTDICKERGDATVFHVQEVRGDPLYCQKIDGHLVPCEAEHLPDLEPGAETEAPEPDRWYLVDASVFINAERWNWEQCRRVLDHGGREYGLVTTDLVWDELEYAYESAVPVEVIEVDPDEIDPRIRELAERNRGEVDPDDKASVADISLIQALVDEPRCRGILTEDRDLHRLHVPSIVDELAERDTRCLTSEEFCERHPGWFETG